MKVEIVSAEIRQRPWGPNARGQSGVFYEQDAIIETGQERRMSRIQLRAGQPAYPLGQYTVDLDSSVYFGRWGDLQLSSTLVLSPLKSAAFPGTKAA